MKKYIVKQEDLIGDIENFPIEIVQRMIECQVEYGNAANVKVFQRCKLHGFAWDETKEGFKFWDSVIHNGDFDLFFEKYPKQQDVKQGNKQEMEKIIIGGVEIKAGMILYLNGACTNELKFGIVFPIKNTLAVVYYGKQDWSYLNAVKERVTAIRDIDKSLGLANGRILWEKPKKVTLTKQQIAEKFGIDIEQLEITE